ncbi:MAG: hypothetical protein DRI86_11475 [Bacteroidetes bacterium]|nr:MAG: hypothetical protein DRI86_11475 [Bacteroidota bacterium]
MISRLLILFVFLLSINFAFAIDDDFIIDISKITTPLDLNEYTYSYSTYDTSSNIHIALKKEFVYAPTAAKGINHNKIYWKRYSLNNPYNATVEQIIYIPYAVINTIIVYSKHNDEINHIASMGMLYKRKDKPVETIGYPIVLNLKPGQTDVYIYFKHFNLSLRTNSVLITKKELISGQRKDEKFIYFWKGVFYFTLFISLFLFMITKLRMFIYYFFLNAGMGVFFLSEMGEITLFFELIPYNMTANLKQTGILLAFVFFPLLINQLTPIAKLRPILWKVMYSILGVVAFFWFGCLFPYFLTNKFLLITTYLYNYYAPFMLFLQLYFVYVAFRAKEKNATFVFMGYSGYVLALFVYVILPNFGILKPSFHIYNTFIYGSLFEVTMFMIMIGKETLSMYDQRSQLLVKQKTHQSEIINTVVKSQEEERNRIGRELHDLVGADISAIKLNMQQEDKMLNNIIDNTIIHIRNISHGLASPQLKCDKFVDEISDLCSLFSKPGFIVKSNFYNWVGFNDQEKIIHIYRIIQELINNAAKHSKATNVSVQFFISENNKVTIMYEDNGIGFNYKDAHKKKGLGLANIENRVHLINGSMVFDSSPSLQTTTVIIEVPV